MINSTQLFFTSFLVLLTLSLNAQIEVDQEKKVGISILPTDNIKLNILNEDQPKSIVVESNYDGGQGIIGLTLGINSTSDVVTYGEKLNIDQTTSKSLYGSYNDLISRGTGDVKAIHNYIQPFGNSLKYGVYNNIKQASAATEMAYGVFNNVESGGTGVSYGTYNKVLGSGTGEKIGTYNNIVQSGNDAAYGEHTTIDINNSSVSYGNYIEILPNGVGKKYGISSKVTQNVNATQPSFGVEGIAGGGPKPASGIQAQTLAEGTGEKRGLNMIVYQSPDSDQRSYGIRSQLFHNGMGPSTYGHYNYVKLQGTSNPNAIFGSATIIAPNSTYNKSIYGDAITIRENGSIGKRYGSKIDVKGGSERYGIYVDVHGDSNENQENIWAGFFNGDISVQNMYTASDIELKENIDNVGYGLKEVLNLDPKSYNYKVNKSSNREIGFIAQEFEKQIPELIKLIPNSDPKDIDGISKAINYQGLIPVLVNAIKEQQSQISEMQAQINQLKK